MFAGSMLIVLESSTACTAGVSVEAVGASGPGRVPGAGSLLCRVREAWDRSVCLRNIGLNVDTEARALVPV